MGKKVKVVIGILIMVIMASCGVEETKNDPVTPEEYHKTFVSIEKNFNDSFNEVGERVLEASINGQATIFLEEWYDKNLEILDKLDEDVTDKMKKIETEPKGFEDIQEEMVKLEKVMDKFIKKFPKDIIEMQQNNDVIEETRGDVLGQIDKIDGMLQDKGFGGEGEWSY